MFCTLCLWIMALPASANQSSDLQQNFEAKIQTLPEKALTFDFVLTKAMNSSSSYKIIKAEQSGTGAAQIKSLAPLDGEAYAKATSYNGRNEPTNPFAPYRQISRGVTVGGKKYFASGTLATAEVSHGYTEFNIGGAFPVTSQFYQTTASAFLHQNLFRDAFGQATRAGAEAGKLTSESMIKQTELNKEDWFFNLARQFYGAWNAQVRVREATETLERKKRLLDMTRLRARRGTAERPDVIQVETALKQAELVLNAERQNLQDTWRLLITILELPADWLNVDPMLVPMKVDFPEIEAKALCAKDDHVPISVNTEKMKIDKEALTLNAERLTSVGRPETLLSMGVTANGVDQRSGPTYPETYSLEHPAYTVGLTLNIPLGNSENESQLMQTRSDKRRLEAMIAHTSSNEKTIFRNLCHDLNRHTQSIEMLDKMKQEQGMRGRLEKERYELGRAPLINMINAEDDLMNVELQHSGLVASEKIIAWNLLKYSGAVLSKINEKEKMVSE
ncbi:MAG: TolC family protein [Bacteriovoracaceae bacterium]